MTKTHELYKEETPEKFEVRAYDEQGKNIVARTQSTNQSHFLENNQTFQKCIY